MTIVQIPKTVLSTIAIVATVLSIVSVPSVTVSSIDAPLQVYAEGAFIFDDGNMLLFDDGTYVRGI